MGVTLKAAWLPSSLSIRKTKLVLPAYPSVCLQSPSNNTKQRLTDVTHPLHFKDRRFMPFVFYTSARKGVYVLEESISINEPLIPKLILEKMEIKPIILPLPHKKDWR